MVMCNRYVKLPEGKNYPFPPIHSEHGPGRHDRYIILSGRHMYNVLACMSLEGASKHNSMIWRTRYRKSHLLQVAVFPTQNAAL
jgi:hypothetical protein